MKKCLSLFLVLALVLSLGITAFAGDAAASVLRLTGDAAEQVVEPQNGESLSADSSTLLRLNVLNDPEAEEYAVTLNGTPLTADHSTSQYHFYSLAASQKTEAVTLLSVENANDATADGEDTTVPTVTITVGSETKTIDLTTDTGAATKKPDAVTVNLDNYDGSFQRIYVDVPDGVEVGTEAKWNKKTGAMSFTVDDSFVTIDGKGQTTKDLYFYDTPDEKASTKRVAFKYSFDEGTTYYYWNVDILSKKTNGYALGPGSYPGGDNGTTTDTSMVYSEITPYNDGSNNTFTGGHLFKYANGAYSGWVSYYLPSNPSLSQIRGMQLVYSDGKNLDVGVTADNTALTNLAEPAWTSLAEASNGLYAATEETSPAQTTTLTVNRPGFYWFPVSFTYDGTALTGKLPMEVRATAAAATEYLTAEEAAKPSFADNAAATKLLNDAIDTVTAAKDNLEKQAYVDGSGYTYTAPTGANDKIFNLARTYYGAPITGAAVVEKELNILQDMAAIANTTDDELRAYRLDAYMKLMNKADSVHAAVDIKSAADRDAYQTMRQAKWNVLKAESFDALNTILAEFDLKISKPGPTITVKLGNREIPVELSTADSTNASSPETKTVTFDNTGTDAMERIYFSAADDVTYGASLNKKTGVLTGALIEQTKGYTNDNLYLYKTPIATTNTKAMLRTQKVNAIWEEDDGTKHYYAINVDRGAQSGLALGPINWIYDASPKEAGATQCYNEADGFLKTSIANNYDAQGVYIDGVQQGTHPYYTCAKPDWEDAKITSKGLYYSENTNAYFARVGRYWLPVSYTDGTDTVTGYVPFQARLANSYSFKTLNYYISKANSVKANASDAAQAELTKAVTTADENKDKFQNSLTLNESGELVATTSSTLYFRDYFGYKPYAESLYEKEINEMLDLTDIFTTWGTNATLAAQQYEAYMRILNMTGGIHRFIDIQSTADRDKYQQIRQAKWDLIHTSDLAGINAVLDYLGLPKIILGDLNGDGNIDVLDVSMLINYVNGVGNQLTDTQKLVAELDGTAGISSLDVALLIKFVNATITSFPAAG